MRETKKMLLVRLTQATLRNEQLLKELELVKRYMPGKPTEEGSKTVTYVTLHRMSEAMAMLVKEAVELVKLSKERR